MKKPCKFWMSILMVLVAQTIWGQPFFSEKTRQFKSNISTRSVMPGASFDINGDLVDDIVVIDRGNTLKTILSTGTNFDLIPGKHINTTTLREWSLAAGDLNNDGIIEVITTGEYSQGSVTSLNNLNPLSRKSFTTNVYAQGSAVIDLDNDGWLDYFLCNEDGPPKTYLNDKTGTLREKIIIPFLENDNTDGSGNYGVVWADVNGDYLPDMILSKCKAGVSDPMDKRRINRLYINNGNGTFTERGADFNLNSGAQTWVTVVADFDNDGDMDALVVNHYSPHQLMENIDNIRFEERPLPVELSTFSFQAVAMDVDNDGLQDVLLSGAESGILLRNTGNMQFEIHKNVFGKFIVNSFSIGDYNDDGFPDIHSHLGFPINEVGYIDDQLWLNNANGNHYLKVNLRGTTSNHTAIGAHITLYTPEGIQVRMVKGGESYGICNSFQQIFGLGSGTEIDSLVVRWPSGIQETYTGLSADETYLIQESRCISRQVLLYNAPIIWKNNDVQLEAPDGYKQYTWSNDLSTPTIAVAPGMYHVSMTDNNGCVTVSKPINVISGCFDGLIDLLKGDTISICVGDALEIFPSVDGRKFTWQDSVIAASYTVNESGMVYVAATDYCDQTILDSIFVKQLNFQFEIQTDSILKGEHAVLQSSESLTNWYKSPDFEQIIGTGSTFKTVALDSTTVFGARATALMDFKKRTIGEHEIPMTNQYHTNTASGNMLFSVETVCIMRQVKVSTDVAGVRRIYIVKNEVDTIFSQSYDLPIGVSTLLINTQLFPGEYNIGTDEKVNVATLGYKSPRLARISGKTAYPYLINDVIQIKSSTFGPTVYLYFFDWEIYSELLYCESGLKTITVHVDTTTSTSDIERFSLSLDPNPVTDWLRINSEDPLDYIELFDMSGKRINRFEGNQEMIFLGYLPTGFYIVGIKKKEILKRFSIIKL